ncbi:hypothetical protein [Actinomyces sp. ZJ308]|uniref:hypothetical protein n=1 Tax=Actinomyces sp. ZJ308 TaxID=2708342 RepID=UPI001AB0311B|nr:hypothetical protein [Actinomyces sp. ZJ308]
MLGLDRGVEFLLLGLQGVHGLSGRLVEDPLGDRLDEVGELGLNISSAGLQRIEDLIAALVGLVVVVGQVDSQRGQHVRLMEEGLDDLRDAGLDLVLAHRLG